MRLLTYMSPGFPRSLFDTFAAVLDSEVEFDETQSGPAPGVDPFAAGDADLGWICSTSFVELGIRGDEPSIELAGVAWVPDDPDVNGRPVYFGDLITLPDSGIETFSDLEGKTIGCNDKVSLSGYYSWSFELADRGLPDDFATRVLTGGHHYSIDRLLAGEIDAALVDSVVRTGRARADQAVADVHIIDRLGPWPVQPLVARSSMSADEIARVRELLLDAADHPDVRAELDAACLTTLVEVGPDHYAPVRAAMDRL